ncbi:doublesex- and mab-3-related transcription factor C2 isoform X5 [Panthera leo]|uniref:doublesex- and mab-3-related transcription factor C2 isoform X5 n=1 Tax=Panthera leo TaxID=9689 RepID=UPI001C6A3429|nr:doublesex- and mab-3-related transcription factor C2 isoform X5 [Panthera leo]XP_042775461.1 doublesex- and mab-3-related transcription factor C2 isoform X5 [Panthera leo]
MQHYQGDDPWKPRKCLLPTTAPQTLPLGMSPEPSRAQSLSPGELSVALQPAPAAETTASLRTSRATSACASFRLASVTNVSSSSGKENIAPQPQTPHGAVPLALTPPGKDNSQGPLLLSRPPEALPLSWTPMPPGPWAPGHWLPPGLSMPPPVVYRLLCQEPTVPLHPFSDFDPGTSLRLPTHGPHPTCPGSCPILMAPLSRESQGPSALPRTCSTLILQPCGTPDPLLLQPQVLGPKWDPGPWEEVEPGEGNMGAPAASRLAWTSAPSERQLQREAAEALVGLKDSSQAPRLTSSVPPNPAWISLLHPCGPPAPAGGRGFQPVGPSLRPSPAPSVALHIGHLGSISLLS